MQPLSFGMKANIGADAESGLVHTITGTAANEHGITQAHALLDAYDQVPVQLSQDSVSGLGQKHGPTDHAFFR